MFNRYYQEELSLLKDLGIEFSKAHPALAPMLSGQTPDPDVERLFEGTAFLTGMIRQKLDDEFPEIVHGLMNLIFPHYLRPIPSATILAFTPKPNLKQTLKIPAGIDVDSIPIDGTSCRFKTCYDVEVHPLSIVDASLEHPMGKDYRIKLSLRLNGIKLGSFNIRSLRFYLADGFAQASNLYYMLFNHLDSISYSSPEGGSAAIMPASCLAPVGFSEKEILLPYPGQAFSGYRILQEYFVLPQKFLFFDLKGFENWKDRGLGSSFDITFYLKDLPFPPTVRKESFQLFTTPIINIFEHDADPIRLDHTRNKYRVRPASTNPKHFQVFSIKSVSGFIQGTSQEKRYIPFEMYSPQYDAQAVYYISFARSPIDDSFDVFISTAYTGGETPTRETLTVNLLCTNASLPESLQLGDISKQTSTSPELVEFGNILPPTGNILPPLGTNLLWRLLSHISINYLSLSGPEPLKTLLDMYIFPDARDRGSVLANKKRVAGIQGFKTSPADRLVNGIMMRGQDLRMTLKMENFACKGDMYMFCSILNYFLGYYATINTYTSLSVTEATSGEMFRWPARIGDRFLL